MFISSLIALKLPQHMKNEKKTQRHKRNEEYPDNRLVDFYYGKIHGTEIRKLHNEGPRIMECPR